MANHMFLYIATIFHQLSSQELFYNRENAGLAIYIECQNTLQKLDNLLLRAFTTLMKD